MKRYRHITVAALFLFLIDVAEAANPHRYRSGLRMSPDKHEPSNKEKQTVIKSLREKTGFTEMDFDEKGFLVLGDPDKYSGGSKTARELIEATMDLKFAIDIESHNHSKVIAFARLSKPISFYNYSSGEKIEVYPIEIDFSDFRKLRGEKEVIAAFDVGTALLHELGHAVLGLRDILDNAEDPGECEEYINRIRRELQLPERESYVAVTTRRPRTLSERTVEFAELAFSYKSSKTRRYTLSWVAEEVGTVTRDPVSYFARKKAIGRPDAIVIGQ